MNWVDEKAHRDGVLQEQGPLMWQFLKAALESALQSFEKHYSAQRLNATFDCQYDRVFLKTSDQKPGAPPNSRNDCVELLYGWDALEPLPLILIRRENKEFDRFTINILENGHRGVSLFTKDGRVISIEEASRHILEPLLFPAKTSQVGHGGF